MLVWFFDKIGFKATQWVVRGCAVTMAVLAYCLYMLF